MDFIKRHSLLLSILSFVFIWLPKAINECWSLAEKIQGANITMPEISIVWFTWITAPLGLIMLGVIFWQVKGKRRLAEPQNRLRIEVERCNVLDFWPQPDNWQTRVLGHMNIIEAKVKFYPKGEIKLQSLELHMGRNTFGAKSLPIIILDSEDTYPVPFEVPARIITTALKKAGKNYIRALYNDSDCRSNEFSIGLAYELANDKSSDVSVPKRPSPELFIEIDNYDFGFGGGGYPPKRFDDDNALWLRLGVTFRMNQTMRIETLYLLLSGDSIQPHDWSPDKSAYYFYFEMPQQVKPGEVRTIQLVAFAKGTKWGSEEKEIRITLPSQ